MQGVEGSKILMNLVFEQRYYNFTTFPVSFDIYEMGY